MSQNKTEFKFTVNADAALVENVIRNWLVANKFAFQAKPGANYYAFNDPMFKGKRGFEYYINAGEVTILAYLGTYEKPKALEGFVGAVMKQDYRNEMAPLFEELKKLENGVPDNMAYTATYSTDASVLTAQPAQNSLNTFMEQNNKKQENMVIIGFVMALVGILISCVGVSYGAILIVLEYYFAVQGLKTKKKGLAIATIVLASINVVILIFSIVLTVLLM